MESCGHYHILTINRDVLNDLSAEYDLGDISDLTDDQIDQIAQGVADRLPNEIVDLLVDEANAQLAKGG